MNRRAGVVLLRILGLLIAASLAVGACLAYVHRQTIEDHFTAEGYDAPARVTSVEEKLSLTDAGKRIFLASKPTVDGSQNFNEQCAEVDHSEQGHVLGCYTGERIHLFDVTDERISGVVEVTAAHELLHAAWQRLDETERRSLTNKLRKLYEKLAADDPELAERMSVYEHLSKYAFANELHSVLGTEVRELPSWLEEHYSRWFTDRASLVDTFDSYHSVFGQLQDEATTLQDEMTPLRSDVEERNRAYEESVTQFNREVADFNARNERYEFADDPEEFERIRSELQARRDVLETSLSTLQADIEHYNAMRERLHELSQVSTELDQHLDSDLAPITTRPEE